MRTYLRIGEVAQLFGITTKTIRHYHKVGLLAEPQRTQAEYRLYTARDVLRILRIRRLQGLGLSLAQIKRILVEPEEEGSLRRVLEHIVAEIDEQMRQLEMRRECIGALLAEATLDAVDHPQETPQIVELARARLAEQGIVPDEAAWKQDRAIFGTLDAPHLPGDAQQLHEAMRRVMDDPEQTRRIVAIGERFASLAGQAADSPRVTLLVEEALGSGWLDQLQQFQHFHAGEHRSDDNHDLLGTLLTEIIVTMLSPAQQRFLEIIREWQGLQEPLHEGK